MRCFQNRTIGIFENFVDQNAMKSTLWVVFKGRDPPTTYMNETSTMLCEIEAVNNHDEQESKKYFSCMHTRVIFLGVGGGGSTPMQKYLKIFGRVQKQFSPQNRYAILLCWIQRRKQIQLNLAAAHFYFCASHLLAP